MAFPAVAGTVAETAVSTAGTSHVINLPTGIQAGELLLILLDKGSTAATFNALTGWTELVDENLANGITIWAKQAVGNEGATVTFTSSAATRSAALAYRISGAELLATQAPELSAVATGTSVGPDSASLSPTGGAKDYLWISMFGMAGEEADDDTWCNTAPTNFTGLVQKACGTAGTNLGGLIAAATCQVNAASQDPGVFNVDVSAAWRAYTIAIHPGPTPIAIGSVGKPTYAEDNFGRTVAVGTTWGTADKGGSWTQYGSARSIYSVGGGVGKIEVADGHGGGEVLLGVGKADIEMLGLWTWDEILAGTDNWFPAGFIARYLDASNFYAVQLRIEVATPASLRVDLRKHVAAVSSGLNTAVVAATDLDASEAWWVRFRVEGTAIKARVWRDGTSEPGTWTNEATDSALTSPGAVGTRYSVGGAGNTNTPLVTLDNLQVGPPGFVGGSSSIVVRGVTVAQEAGGSVAVGKVAAATAVRGVTVSASGSAPVTVGRVAAATLVRGVTPAGTGTVAVTIGKVAAATTVRGVTPSGSGSVAVPVGKVAAASTVRGVTVSASGSASVPTGKVAAATVVRGVTPTGSGTVSVPVGRVAAAGLVRGLTPTGSGTVNVPVGKVAAATTVRGVTVSGGAATIPVGAVASSSTVRGVTVAASGSATVTIGKVAAASAVRGVTVSASGTAPVPVGRVTSSTLVRGVTVSASGAAPVAIGRATSTLTVRGVTVAATGTVAVTIGRVASTVTVRGVTVAGPAMGSSLPTRLPESTGTVYYVDKDHGSASDSNAGTSQSAPWATIKKAMDDAPANSIVKIKKATTPYVHNAVKASNAYLISRGGSVDNTITLEAFDAADKPVIRQGITLSGINASYWRFRNLIFDGGGTDHVPGDGLKITYTGLVTGTGNGAHDIAVDDCEFKEFRGQTQTSGVLISGGDTHSIQFWNPSFHDNGVEASTQDHGIYISSGHDIWLINFKAFNNEGYGVHIYNGGSGGDIERIYCVHGVMDSNDTRSGSLIRSDMADGRIASDVHFINCISTRHTAGGTERAIRITYTTSPGNNVNSFESCIFPVSPTAQGNSLAASTHASTTQTNVLNADPEFVDITTNDYHLLATSPAYNAGVAAYTPAFDFDGNERLVSTIGPYAAPEELNAIPIGKVASGGVVRGVTPSGSGAATVAVGKVAAATVVRGVAVSGSGTVSVAVGKKAATTTVYGVTVTVSASSVTVGTVAAATAVRGVAVAASGSVNVPVGKVAATLTVRGVTVSGGGSNFAVGRVASSLVVRGATVSASGSASVPVGRAASSSTVRGVTVSGSGSAPVPLGRVVSAAAVRGVTVSATGGVSVSVGRVLSALTVRGVIVTGGGAATVAVGTRTATSLVRGLTPSATGSAAVPVGRAASSIVVRGVTPTGVGTVQFTVGRRASTLVVRGLTIQHVAPVGQIRLTIAPAGGTTVVLTSRGETSLSVQPSGSTSILFNEV